MVLRGGAVSYGRGIPVARLFSYGRATPVQAGEELTFDYGLLNDAVCPLNPTPYFFITGDTRN